MTYIYDSIKQAATEALDSKGMVSLQAINVLNLLVHYDGFANGVNYDS